MSTGTDVATDVRGNTIVTTLGLEVDASIDASALATIDGPFVTADVAGGDGGGLLLCVAVRDAMTAESEGLLESLVTSVAAGAPMAPGAPVAGGAQLEARFTTPFDVTALTSGGIVQALVLTASDRRGASGAPATPAPAPAPMGDLGTAPVGGFDKLVNVALDVSVELGRTRVTLAEVLDYDVGSVVELDRAAGAPVDVRVNGMLLAQGEVVLVDDEYAVRITAIIDPPVEG